MWDFSILYLLKVWPKMNINALCWSAPSSIQRGLEWSQCLNCLRILCVCASKFSIFFLFHPPLFIQYSTEECSTVQYKAAGPPARDCSECDYQICSRMNLKTHYQTNCNGCAKRFCSRCHLKTHNTFREAVRLYNILAHSTQ